MSAIHRLLRILHVIGGLETTSGGPNVVLPEMTRALADRGHEVHIFTTTPDLAQFVPPHVGHGAHVHAFARTVPDGFATSPNLARALGKHVRHFDVVHLHSLYLFQSTVAPQTARHHGVPYVIRPHGTFHPLQRRVSSTRKAIFHRLFEDRNLARAAAIHYTSATEQAHARAAGVTTTGWVIPLAVSPHPDRKEANAFLTQYPGLRDRRLVVYLGRLTPKKRPELLVEAFRAVASADPGAHLVLAGPDDGSGAVVRAAVQASGLDAAVTLPGTVVGDMKMSLLDAASVFVLPSDWENFGLSVAEAMAAGVPVVVTPGVDIAPEIKASSAGIVVEQSVDAIAQAIIDVFASAEWAGAMGERGRDLVSERYSWNAVSERLEHMYSVITADG